MWDKNLSIILHETIQGESPPTATIDCGKSIFSQNLKFRQSMEKTRLKYFRDGAPICFTENKYQVARQMTIRPFTAFFDLTLNCRQILYMIFLT